MVRFQCGRGGACALESGRRDGPIDIHFRLDTVGAWLGIYRKWIKLEKDETYFSNFQEVDQTAACCSEDPSSAGLFRLPEGSVLGALDINAIALKRSNMD